MPFFIKVCERKTWTKYLVEAADQRVAEDAEGEYLGYVDADNHSCVVHGPFDSRGEAMSQLEAWTEGR